MLFEAEEEFDLDDDDRFFDVSSVTSVLKSARFLFVPSLPLTSGAQTTSGFCPTASSPVPFTKN